MLLKVQRHALSLNTNLIFLRVVLHPIIKEVRFFSKRKGKKKGKYDSQVMNKSNKILGPNKISGVYSIRKSIQYTPLLQILVVHFINFCDSFYFWVTNFVAHYMKFVWLEIWIFSRFIFFEFLWLVLLMFVVFTNFYVVCEFCGKKNSASSKRQLKVKNFCGIVTKFCS